MLVGKFDSDKMITIDNELGSLFFALYMVIKY